MLASVVSGLQVMPSRRAALGLLSSGVAVGTLGPGPSGARSPGEKELKAGNQETDLKGMLGGFSEKLKDDEKAKELRKLEEAKPLNAKIVDLATKGAPTAKPRPKPGTAQPRVKKSTASKPIIGDGTL